MDKFYILLILVCFNTAMIFNLYLTISSYRKTHNWLKGVCEEQARNMHKLSHCVDIMVKAVTNIRKALEKEEQELANKEIKH